MLHQTTYWTGYYTKDQTLQLLAAWGVQQSLPKKGMAVIVAFPNQETGKVTRYAQPSTYGKPLYCVELMR